ncbi:hypothetical protein Hanom_Chr09g00807201 [Helianthus anomalus]
MSFPKTKDPTCDKFKKKYLILRRTLDISSLFFFALLWVPNFLLATFNARLSFPTFNSSVILFSYGANPATSRIKLLTK